LPLLALRNMSLKLMQAFGMPGALEAPKLMTRHEHFNISKKNPKISLIDINRHNQST
jgi:hypothetical protein